MKSVYVCGSFKFLSQIEELENMLTKENIVFMVSKSLDAHGILRCLERIDQADVVYVVNPKGYVGKSVSLDIGYAYAKNKPIYVMHSIDDPPVMSLIKSVLSFNELIRFLKHDGTLKM
ncbi:nucleotide pyrophosphohydrolase [Candidatus Bathyarchaeota archaeon]|nr:nucleotide pyrophosphohydrolase [Candidatus Bathyarchaeota archaeon]MBS7630281.1 nucleotide pyrophosphohydrolase [Candidatus Bathyarchaeota archaeon]